MKPWIGVDFDGTLAHYDGFKGADVLGAPIPLMVDRVKRWLDEGRDVRIFTARVWHPDITSRISEKEYNERMLEAREARNAIKAWCIEHIGVELPITCEKDYGMVSLFDDRAVQVETNTGVLLQDKIQQFMKEVEDSYEQGIKRGKAMCASTTT